jgi:ectoine hydroxylase-related dioxygenase (phytanoyl-CoA dioxygenase family)
MSAPVDGVDANFARDGFVVCQRALDRAQVESLRTALASLDAGGKIRSKQILYTHVAPPPDHPGMERLMDQWLNVWRMDVPVMVATLRDLRERVSRALGFDAIPFQDVALSKAAHHAPFPWHQDLPFWPTDRDDGAVSWIALDPTGEENGGLELAPTSHRWPVGPAIDLHTGQPQPGASGTASAPEVGRIPPLDPGDLLVFHARCWHRSGRNGSEAPRRAWSVSWLHPEARWSFARAPRHPIRSRVVEGEEVLRWSFSRYPL